jgi:hypothetical protein
VRYIVLAIFAAACFDGGNTPESALKDFVESRLNGVVTRADVIARTTGKMRLSVESMDDKDFDRFADLRQYKRDSYRVISKSCQEKKCYVTYALGYHKAADVGGGDWATEVKKIVEIQWVDGQWLIADVSNIKTYHETSQNIDVTP